MHQLISPTVLLALCMIIGGCSTNIVHEGQGAVDYDGLSNPSDTVDPDGAPDDTASGGDTAGDGAQGDTAGTGECGDSGNACAPDELCNPQTGECEPAGCGDSGEECAPDEFCNPETGECEPGGCDGNGLECAPNEQCNPVTGACEPIPQCGDVNEACDPNTPEPLPFVCVEYQPGEGICRRHCVGPTFDEDNEGTYIDPCDTCDDDDECGAGLACLANGLCGDADTGEVVNDYDCAAPPGQTSYCVPSGCDSYFENTCGIDATCLPTWINDLNACVPDGVGGDGSDCFVHTDCDHDLLCVDGLCAKMECAPSGFPGCDDDLKCISAKVAAEELDVGWCAAICDAFSDDCLPTEWCIPEVDKPEPGAVNGYCTPDLGDAPEGTECGNSPNICDKDLMCVKSPGNPAQCEQVCDPDSHKTIDKAGACTDGYACVPLLVVDDDGLLDEVMDFGSCTEGCAPWGPAGASECVDTWCLPTSFNPTDGQCLGDLGQVQKGGMCDDTSIETSCGPGMLCLEATAGAQLSGTCRVLCRAGAPAGGTGATCLASEDCVEFDYIGANGKAFNTGIGWCNPHP